MTRFSSSSLRAIVPSLTLAFSLLALTACATADNRSGQETESEIADPLEGVNRAVFGVNTAADILFIGPASTIYHEGMPEPVQTGVRNVYQNLELPVIAINKLFQGKFEGFGTALARFAINSTVGLAGLIDVASSIGLPYEDTDFGVTLASWGVEPMAYVVLPFFGPSSVRDSIGLGVDTMMDPVRYGAREADLTTERYVVSGLKILDKRAQASDLIEDTWKNSLDPYATMRSLYSQYRTATIRAQVDGETQSPPAGKSN